jgi:hypothetical protein
MNIPLPASLILDKNLSAALFQSYARLFTIAWDGERKQARDLTLTFDELRELWGTGDKPLSRAGTFLHLRLLRAKAHIAWTTNGDGKYRISFPCSDESKKLDSDEIESIFLDSSRLSQSQKLDLGDHESRNLDSNTAESKNLDAAERESASPEIWTPESESELINVSDSGHLLSTPPANPFWRDWLNKVHQSAARDREDRYYAALKAGQVYRQFWRPWARQLAEKGPDYLPHLLGWIAYSRSDECEQDKPGAVVKTAVEEREPVDDPKWLPPVRLNFEQALAWALAGGHDAELGQGEARFESIEGVDDLADDEHAEQPTQPSPLPDPVLDAPLFMLLPGTISELSPREIWRSALGQLQLEMSRSTFNAWLRDTTPLAVETVGGNTLVISVLNPYTKDWLENRLQATVRRTLTGLVGSALGVRFEVCLVETRVGELA